MKSPLQPQWNLLKYVVLCLFAFHKYFIVFRGVELALRFRHFFLLRVIGGDLEREWLA